ncbi:hypothetical protein MK805_15480 [Shimazuella sp. AN120528]|nr:hypothetical protein [Shimazuella soli]
MNPPVKISNSSLLEKILQSIINNIYHILFLNSLVIGLALFYLSPITGVSLLIGMGISGLLSWFLEGNLHAAERDAVFGGLSALVGLGVGSLSLKLLGSRLVNVSNPFIQKWLPIGLSSGAAGSSDSLTFDYLRERKVDWKKTGLVGLLSIFLGFGGLAVSEYGGKIIKNIPVPVVVQTNNGEIYFSSKSLSNTALGQWIQKFASEEVEGVTRIVGRGKKYETDDGALIAGKKVAEINKLPKYHPVKNQLDLKYVAKLRKELGIPSIGDDLRLKKEGVLKAEQTVAVLQSNGVEIWGRNGWGVDVENGYKEMLTEWFKKRSKGSFGTNANTRFHAEGDVFWHLYKFRKANKLLGGKAVLAVDRSLCRYCDQSKGVQQMVEEVGLDELKVITPDGIRIIKPEPSRRRTSWEVVR